MHSKEVIERGKKLKKWVEWSDEDNIFIFNCPEYHDMQCHYENNPTDEVETYRDGLDLLHHQIKIDLEEENKKMRGLGRQGVRYEI